MLAVPADLCINSRWVLPMTMRDRILENHTLVVRDGRILDLLPTGAAHGRFAPSLVLERPEHLLMPGLVDAHSRAGASPGRGARKYPGSDFVYDGTQLSIGAMLRSGITCFADTWYFPHETARAAVAQGMRAVIGMPLAEHAGAGAISASEYLSQAVSVRDEFKGHPFISTVFAPHSPLETSDATFGRIATLADELDAGIMLRLHESAAQIAASVERHGRRPLERLAQLGLLTPALSAVDMAEVNAEDIDLARRAGLSVTLCPTANLRRCAALPPIAAWAAAGIRLGIGSDGGAFTSVQDLWTDIKLLAMGSRPAPDALPSIGAWDALASAGRGAASALGLEAEIGTLEIGKWADLCCVDLSGPATQPGHEPMARLVFSGGRDIVSDVWVAGRQLLSAGGFTRLDWPAIKARAHTWAARAPLGG